MENFNNAEVKPSWAAMAGDHLGFAMICSFEGGVYTLYISWHLLKNISSEQQANNILNQFGIINNQTQPLWTKKIKQQRAHQ